MASLPALQLPGGPHLVKGLSRDTLTQVGCHCLLQHLQLCWQGCWGHVVRECSP